MLSISVLGTLRVVIDGERRAVTSRRQRALLAALALRHPRVVPVDELVDAVWDAEPPAGAVATLQTYVSRLRSILGERVVVREPAGYRLGEDVTIDVTEARHALAEAEQLLAGDPTRAGDVATSALDLWDGTALAELAGLTWFVPQSVALQELHDNLVETRADALVRSGRVVEAVEVLEAVVRSHPFRERAQLLLVRALGQAGRSADALRAADRYRSELRDQTGLDPGPELAALEDDILNGRLPSDRPTSPQVPKQRREPSTARRAGLPRPTELVGRSDALGQLQEQLAVARLVTVLGTGGVGKTRLVAELLAEVDRHPQPVVVVELASVGPADVLDAVATAAGYRAGPATIDAVADVLGAEPTLVVLDNCEHVVDEVRSVVRGVLDGCPSVVVLTTSRIRLALPDEHILALQPLATDGDDAPAVRMFAECLRRVGTGSDIDVGGEAARRLCVHLDGIPLALELAAGRAALLGLDALTARPDAIPDLLAVPATAGGGHHRHASPRAMVAWSFELLAPEERRLLAVLSVFDGEFDLDAVEVVAGELLDRSVGPVFARLVDASLVGRGGGTGRFRLLQMIRLFAAEQLSGTDDESRVRRGHVRWVGRELERVAERSCGPDEAETSELLDALRPDIRAAMTWAGSRGDRIGLAAIADSLATVLIYRPDAELAASVHHVAEGDPGDGLEGCALSAAGARAGYLLGSLDSARRLAERALAAGGAASGQPCVSRARHAIGVVNLYEGRHEEAEEAFRLAAEAGPSGPADRCDALGGAALAACYLRASERATGYAARHRALAEASGSATALAFADYVDGERAVARGALDEASVLLRSSAERAWEARAPFVWGVSSTLLASMLVRSDRFEEAAELLPLLLHRWRRTATWTQLWTSLRQAAVVLVHTGELEAAVTVLTAAELDAGSPGLDDEEAARLGRLKAHVERRLPPDRVAVAEARAAVLTRGAVLDLAVEALSAG